MNVKPEDAAEIIGNTDRGQEGCRFSTAIPFFSRQQTDNWAAQAKAERGKGIAWLYPYVAFLVIFAIAAAIWTLLLPIPLRSDILAVCWPILGVITVLQTAWMVIKAMKRYRGFKA